MDGKVGRKPVPAILWLIIGCVCVLFMGGKWNIIIATWIGSIFILRYFRSVRGFWGIVLSLPFLLAASRLFMMGLADAQTTLAFQLIIIASYTVYLMLPCLIDRLLHGKIGNPLLSTLVYPAALIVIQFLLSYMPGLGTVLTWTGTLFDMKPLIQLVSVTGVWGPSFLVGWFASVFNALWEKGFNLRRVLTPAAVYCGVFITVMAWGGARCVFSTPRPGTVKVGSVVVGLPKNNLYHEYLDQPVEVQQARREEYRRWSLEVQEQLFAASERLAPSGIKILSWASGNAVVFAEDEERLIGRLQAFAREHGLYIFPSLLVMGDHEGPDHNRVLAIRPDGSIAYTHFKGRNPNAGHYQGNEIETVDTPYGRIASPICYEMEFHRFIRQVGQKQVDILIVPGDEPSKANAVVHTELSMFRCIENGCSMLRTTLEGLTLSADYLGRVLARMNFYQTLDERTLISEMPMRGVRTLYSRWGDWFAYLSAIFLIVAAGFSLRRNTVKPDENRVAVDGKEVWG